MKIRINTWKSIALLAAIVAICAVMAACGKKDDGNTGSTNSTTTTNNANTEQKTDNQPAAETKTDDNKQADQPAEPAAPAKREYTAFFAFPQPNATVNKGNGAQEAIYELTGAKVTETWLTGQTDKEAVGTMIAGGEYPDFINGSDGTAQLLDAGALIPLEDYIFSGKYPNIQNYFTAAQWERFRRPDGHIYYINPFATINGKEMTPKHDGEAFWIQTRVLKWDNWPDIKTMDEYFDLIERYYAANPKMDDGTPNIPYTILCDDWRYFCLENAPQFLAGYPNDGSVIVDVNSKKVVDYNTIPEAKVYFGKLSEEYKKGIVDTESFTQTYDEYIAKLSTGRVLGMIDQYWDFIYSIDAPLLQQGLYEKGCGYVPLPISISRDVKNQWHTTGLALNDASGMAITVSCKDVEGALQFVNDILGQEAMALRNWGVAGVDYEIGADGLFYRTQQQRDNAGDPTYQSDHFCNYSFFPHWQGMLPDNINAVLPDEQPLEYLAVLQPTIRECFEAYGKTSFIDMLGNNPEPGPWFPMYSFSGNMTTETPGGMAWTKIGELKHEYLPKIVIANDFETAWTDYMKRYSDCKPEDFLAEMQVELDRRIAMAK